MDPIITIPALASAVVALAGIIYRMQARQIAKLEDALIKCEAEKAEMLRASRRVGDD